MMIKRLNNLFKPRLKLVRGTRFVSFLFIGFSVLISAGILLAANVYFNIDTQEVVTEQIQRVTGVLRATAGLIVGGTASQNPASGYVFEVVGQTKLATTTVATGQLEFTGSDTFSGFKAPSSYGTTTPMVYILPQHGNPSTTPAPDYVLTWQTGNQLLWKSIGGAGGGDVNTVGDCTGPECFTQTGGAGNNLWFITGGGGRIQLTGATTTSNFTITLPAATGSVALGTSTTNYVAYWTGTSTLAGEAQLSTTRGGTGQNSSTWSGMVHVVSGAWSPITGTAGYAAYWSDANTVSAEQFLATARGGLGANVTPSGAGELLYSTSTTAYARLAAGAVNQILTSGGAAAPSWKNIADLITVQNGLTASGTTQLTIQLGGALATTTTITQGGFDMVFNLTGTGDFKVQNAGTDIFTVTDDGRILFKTYPLAQSGKEILRAMAPVFGFDLPAQTATTSFVQISKTIQDYPFSNVSTSTGATMIHKFSIRISAATTTASTSWRVFNETTNATVTTFDVVLNQSTDIEKGQVYISPVEVTIPTTTDDWRLDMKTNGNTVRVFQIFLAAYEKLQ